MLYEIKIINCLTRKTKRFGTFSNILEGFEVSIQIIIKTIKISFFTSSKELGNDVIVTIIMILIKIRNDDSRDV